MQNPSSQPSRDEQRRDDRRRDDWQANDRRQNWPWVTDSNDQRTGQDRRLNERRMREGVAARSVEQSRRSNQKML